MDRIEKENVSVGTGIISTYNRMPQKYERVFAEFIDNATQSFRDHKKELNDQNVNINKVKIVWNNDEIIIEDNSFGMTREEFRRALRLNSPASSYSDGSRSQYGMGLKIAAVYLGNWYSIETTRLGSTEKYKAIVDVDEWKRLNPTEIDVAISNVQEKDHYTKITIKRLIKPLTEQIDNSLRKKLSTIYSEDLGSGEFELYLNGRQILKEDPELRINASTGSEYLEFIEDKFEFGNEIYEYNGWVGILKTASTDFAGFTLSQSGRGIKINYRPGEIFGKSNSFQYQRVVGNLNLDGKNWKTSFNKDEFVWDNGLEKKFIESLKSNQQIRNIMSTAGALRKEGKKNPIINSKDIEKNSKTTQEKFSNLQDTTKTQIQVEKPNIPIVKIECKDEEKPCIIDVTWEGIQYSFDIKVNNDNYDGDWFSLQKKDDSNGYYIILNSTSDYFSNYNNKKECKSLIIDFAVTLALAQLSSVRLGCKWDKSSVFISQFNKIIKSIKEN